MPSIRTSIAQLAAAIDADDYQGFARAFTALVDLVGAAPAKAIVRSLIAERQGKAPARAAHAPISFA